jgi:[ribosomal protein S5]-alanine N-acetyltransferase
MRKAPHEIASSRLTYRRPTTADAQAIFERYASDPDATRYMAWPVHRTINDTYAFLTFSDSEWRRWPAGPFLVRAKEDDRLLGSTGYAFEAPDRAITGYIFARDAWGQGYATEALRAMVELAPRIGIRVLTASCHADHAASARVLEKCGFVNEGRLPRQMVFPNVNSREPMDVLSFSLTFR